MVITACVPMVIWAYRSLKLVIEQLLKLLVIGLLVEEGSKVIVQKWSAKSLSAYMYNVV